MKTICCTIVLLLMLWLAQSNGQTQHSLLFDGVDDYVSCGNDASLDIKGQVTLEVWLFPNDNIFSYRRFIVKEWETSYNLGAGANANSVLFGMAPNGILGNTLETGQDVLSPLTWVHVAGTWDGSMLRIFVNGEEVAQKPWINNSVTGSSNPTILGTDQNLNPLRHFNGRMDEVRIWNVARTQQEIRDNMYKELTNPQSEVNLVAYYGFNEGAGQVTADLSQQNNTAILGGTLGIEVSDPQWANSTAPIPFYTILNGNWGNKLRWAAGQGVPEKNWARIRIDHAMYTDGNYSIGSVTINTMGSLTITSGDDFTVNDHLSILSSATGTGSLIVSGSIDYGDALIERYYTGNEWHFISPSVSNAVSGLFTGLYLQYHDEATNGYSDIIPTNIPLVPGKGYAIWNPDNAKAGFTGTLNLGTVGSMHNLNRSGAGNDFGWNLVGNPYPSAIDWNASSGWTKNNINNAIYIHVNAATWATYIGGIGVNGGSRYIAPGQGFFVSVADNGGLYPESGSLVMNKEIAVHNNVTYFKDDPSNFVRIEIAGNGYTDETVIRFHEQATTAFDQEWDAHKLFGYKVNAPQIYSQLDQKYAINSMPAPSSVVLGVKALNDGVFTISATQVDGVEYLFLEDLTLQKVTDLLQESYTFSYFMGAPDEQFVLHFEPVAGSDEAYQPDSRIYFNGQNIVVEHPGVDHGDIQVFNITGQIIHQTQMKNDKTVVDGLIPGTYIIQLVTQNWVKTSKVQVNY